MKNILFAAIVSAFVFGCQTMPYQPYARDVKKAPGQSGVIALHTEHRDEDRAKADTMMKTNCGDKPVKVTEEGEVVVGQTTTGNTSASHHSGTSGQKVGSLFGMPIMSGGANAGTDTASTSTTTNVKEWQIAYTCTETTKSKKH